MFNNAISLCHKIEDLYLSQDLPGGGFIQLLNNYHGYMIKKNSECSGLSKIAWKIIHIASGVFAYPYLGLFATLGMFLNLLGISGVKSHNAQEKQSLKSLLHIPIVDSSLDDAKLSFIIRSGWNMQVVREYVILPTSMKEMTDENKDAILQPIENEIDSFTSKYQKIYVQYIGNWAKGAFVKLALFQYTPS